MRDRLSTGVPFLDDQLGGGVMPGHLVCLRTAPGSQGELLLREMAVCHGGLYLSTTRTDDAVADWLWPATNVDVEYVGVDGLMPRGGDAVRDFVRRASGWSDEAVRREADRSDQLDAVALAVRSATGSVVIDPVNPLEAGEESAYLGLLNGLRRRVQETRSLGFLHVTRSEPEPPGRWMTLQSADEVWDVDTRAKNGNVEFVLAVTKSRSDQLPDREIKLDLGEVVDVDTSRYIA